MLHLNLTNSTTQLPRHYSTVRLDHAFNASPAGIVQFFSCLNIFLSIPASLGNFLVLIALRRVSSIHPPTKLFFRCLAVTDLCVGLIVQPFFATYIMSRITQMNVNVLYYVNIVRGTSTLILCVVSILTSTAISVDRLLALLLGLRYRHVVTLRRVRVVVICFCLIGASIALMRMWRKDIAFKAVSVIIILSLITSLFSYTRIHLKLRHQQAQVQNHLRVNGAGSPLNIAIYKKTVSSIMWVQLALVACYVPIDIVTVLYVNGIYNDVAWLATNTICFLNSSLNPILYCWKIREVRQQVKNTIRQLRYI